MEVSPEIMKARQGWFWRRLTLQLTLLALVGCLVFEVCVTASRVLGWTDVAVILILAGAIVFLVSMYFAMVDNAEKLKTVVGSVGDAIGDARGVGGG